MPQYNHLKKQWWERFSNSLHLQQTAQGKICNGLTHFKTVPYTCWSVAISLIPSPVISEILLCSKINDRVLAKFVKRFPGFFSLPNLMANIVYLKSFLGHLESNKFFQVQLPSKIFFLLGSWTWKIVIIGAFIILRISKARFHPLSYFFPPSLACVEMSLWEKRSMNETLRIKILEHLLYETS